MGASLETGQEDVLQVPGGASVSGNCVLQGCGGPTANEGTLGEEASEAELAQVQGAPVPHWAWTAVSRGSGLWPDPRLH